MHNIGFPIPRDPLQQSVPQQWYMAQRGPDTPTYTYGCCIDGIATVFLLNQNLVVNAQICFGTNSSMHGVYLDATFEGDDKHHFTNLMPHWHSQRIFGSAGLASVAFRPHPFQEARLRAFVKCVASGDERWMSFIGAHRLENVKICDKFKGSHKNGQHLHY